MIAEGYRYGLFLNPQPGDVWCANVSEAERMARKMSIDNQGTPVAVWDANDQTLKLFAGYEEFEPVK